MIVHRFLAWAQNAPADARAQATGALALAYLQSDMATDERHEAEIALTSLLDDPSIAVRRAISAVFAASDKAPRHIISTLASDHPDVAGAVLAESPLLSDDLLLECAAQGHPSAQCAVAGREVLSIGLLSQLIDICKLQAAIVLAARPSTPDRLLRRLLERFPGEGALRETVLSRGDISAVLRIELVSATAVTLSNLVTMNSWLPRERAERTTRDAIEQAHLLIAAEAGSAGTAALTDFVRHLRRSGRLTAKFLLRALVTGHRDLCVTAIADLSGLPSSRVVGILEKCSQLRIFGLTEQSGASRFIGSSVSRRVQQV